MRTLMPLYSHHCKLERHTQCPSLLAIPLRGTKSKPGKTIEMQCDCNCHD